MLSAFRRKIKVLSGSSKSKPAPKTTGRDAGAIAAKIMRDKEQKKYVGFLPANDSYEPDMSMVEAKKKCGQGEYYCNDDKKCKPIPKGYR